MDTIALAANALTTPATVRLLLGATASEGDQGTAAAANDQVITLLINEASAWIEGQLERQLACALHTEALKGTGSQYLLLKQWPISVVYAVVQGGDSIPPEAYEIEPEGYAGVLYKDDGWTYHGHHHGLADDPIASKRDITVSYRAGYRLPKDATPEAPATLPADLEGLCRQIVLRSLGQLHNGGAAGLKSFAISDVRWEWDRETPPSWQATLNAYKRLWA